MKRYFKSFIVVLIGVFISSCAAQKSLAPSQTHDLNPKAGQYAQKVDNFLVLLDASASMDASYDSHKKLTLAKDVVHRMNHTIPNMKLNGALRTFGHSYCPFSNKTTLIYGLDSHSKAGLDQALKPVRWAGGKSPLDRAINAATEDLKSAQGDIAVIIVSDADNMDNTPVEAANAMKRQFGDRVCIYGILVGNDPGGRDLMDKMTQAGGCGFSVNADSIASAAAMADFVEKVFFDKAKAGQSRVNDSDGDGVRDDLDKCPNTPAGAKVDAKGCPMDTDGDGVPDYLDRCPQTPSGVQVDENGCPLDSDKDGVYDYLDKCQGTPKGANVDKRGCWVPEGIRFDNDKWDIKAQSYPALDEVVQVLRQNPTLRILVEGHTDSVGAKTYNKRLSENRARAVKDYLVEKGINSERLSSVGHGFLKPIASNDTPEGRAQNRRVQLTPMH